MAEAANDSPPSLGDLIKCVDREIGFRRGVYPRWVLARKMSQEKADLELLRMRAVRASLVKADAEQLVLTGLAERFGVGQEELAALRMRAEAVSEAAYPLPSSAPVAP